nr:glycoside hydrolase 100 family protein [Anthocerotibacter panamensis]
MVTSSLPSDAQSYPGQETTAPKTREQATVQLARDLFYNRAMIQFEGAYMGALAAIPQAPHTRGARKSLPPALVQHTYEDLNYTEVFIRDNIPVMIFLLLDGKGEVVRNFLDTCLNLQSTRLQTAGIFPTSFFVQNGKLVADYGQRAIGRVSSADATLWWPILAYIYVQHTGDKAWAREPKVQIGLKRFLDLVLHPTFSDTPVLLVPDGSFMIDRPLDVWGAPLEIETLLDGALLSAAGLLYLDLTAKGCVLIEGETPTSRSLDTFTQGQIEHFNLAVERVKRLRRYLLKHYWVNTKTVQVLRQRPTEQYGDLVVNEYNIQTESIPHWLQHWIGTEGGYLIGNIRTGRPDFRFFTLGNCLGAIFDVLSPYQQHAFFHLVVQNQEALVGQMPLRICHPPLDDSDWRTKTGYDRKNLPWCYHNGGHWPCLLWYLAVAALRYQQRYSSPNSSVHVPYHRKVQGRIQEMLHDAYELLLERLPQQNWAEYFDGPTGLWTGQQTRYYQTWTIVGFLLVHHLLKVNPGSANIMDVPGLKFLSRVRMVPLD